MTIYRLVVTIPSEIFIDVESLADAQTFIEWISGQYDKVDYPIKTQSDDRSGIAQVKCLSIEPASENDKITMMNSTSDAIGSHLDAMAARKGLGISPETPTEPPDGPNAA